jgi:predicted MPP superfamily phosphohydrolase
MSRTVARLVFLGVVILVAVGLHAYLWVRLVADPLLPDPWRLLASALLVAMPVGMPLFMALSAARPRLSRWLGYPVFVWMGLLFLLFALLLAADLLQLLVWLGHLAAGAEHWSADPARRVHVARLVAGGVVSLALVAATWSLVNGLGRPRIRRLELALARLPAALDGFTIAQLTDLHLSARRGGRWLAGIVARTNALAPELVAITGDLVDGSVEALGEAAAPLADLRAPAGVFFVTGNHDYYSGVEPWIAALRRLGVRVLRNERAAVGRGEATFDLAGVDDYSAGQLAPGHGPDFARALRDRDHGRALVLLAHQPKAIFEAAAEGVDLVLSGHTHGGGQLWPFKYLVRLQQPYTSGLVRVGETLLYVSEGTGYWGPPMRLGTRAEITLVTLRAARATP